MGQTQELFAFWKKIYKKIPHFRWVHLLLKRTLEFFSKLLAKYKGFKFPEKFDWDWKLEMLLNKYETGTTKLVRKIVKPGMVVIDVGAHIGYYTRIFSKLTGNTGHVYAFEALEENFQLLAENTKKLLNVSLINKAVSNICGTVRFYKIAHSTGCHSLIRPSEDAKEIDVPTVTLDEFVIKLKQLPRVDIIKIDIEGAESIAFEGMASIIDQMPSLTIIMEFFPTAILRSGKNPKDWLINLKKLGFKINEIDPRGNLRPVNTDNLENMRFSRVGAVNLILTKINILHKAKAALVTPYGAEARLDNFAEFRIAVGLISQGYDVNFYTYKLRRLDGYSRNKCYKGVRTFRCMERFGIAPGLIYSIIKYKPRYLILFHPRSMLNFSAYIAGRISGARILTEIVGILHDPYVSRDRDNPYETLRTDIRLSTRWTDILKIFSLNPMHNWLNLVYHLHVAKSDAIIAINKEEQSYIKRFYNRDSALVYWGIPKNQAGQSIKPDSGQFPLLPHSYLLLLAQVKKRKGWDTVIEALSILKKQGTKKNLVFLCPINEGIEEVKTLAQEMNILDNVLFYINVTIEERNWLYQNAQYVLAPSRYEGFGLPVFEAFQANRPLCATDIPVYMEFLEHKKNAMISKAGNAQELANNIIELDNDPQLQESLALNGRRTLLEYSDDRMVNEIVNVLNSLSAKPHQL